MSANQCMWARMAATESVTKLVATGFRHEDALPDPFQEYFERSGNKPEALGQFRRASSAGHRCADRSCIASIGGKDSMSGSLSS